MSKKRTAANDKRKYGLKTRFTKESLIEALQRIKAENLTLKEASVIYDIPRTTLINKLNSKHMKSVGRPCILSDEEENLFKQTIFSYIHSGIQISPNDVRQILKKYLDKNGKIIPFVKNNMVTWEWAKLFLNRHEDLKNQIYFKKRNRNNICVNPQILTNFIDDLELYLEDIPPQNIFNFIEVKFCDSSKTNAFLLRNNFQFLNSSDNLHLSGFTVIFCGNAIGETSPPYVIYKGKRKFDEWLLGAPIGTHITATKNGWVDVEAFNDWFKKIMLPFLTTKDGKKILIGDKSSCHLSNSILKLFDTYNVNMIQLAPNTSLLQPLEIEYIKALKSQWCAILNAWRNTAKGNESTAISKIMFATLLNKTLQLGQSTYKSKIIAGFETSGIHPFNRNVVLQKLPKQKGTIKYKDNLTGENVTSPPNEHSNPLKPGSSQNSLNANTTHMGNKYSAIHLDDQSDDDYHIERLDEDYLEKFSDIEQIDLSECRYCIINFECSLFPAKVLEISEQYCKLAVLRKDCLGWSLINTDVTNYLCKIEDIVKVLNIDQVTVNQDGLTIDDDDLNAEWGD